VNLEYWLYNLITHGVASFYGKTWEPGKVRETKDDEEKVGD
jgi:hypothetical protein